MAGMYGSLLRHFYCCVENMTFVVGNGILEDQRVIMTGPVAPTDVQCVPVCILHCSTHAHAHSGKSLAQQ